MPMTSLGAEWLLWKAAGREDLWSILGGGWGGSVEVTGGGDGSSAPAPLPGALLVLLATGILFPHSQRETSFWETLIFPCPPCSAAASSTSR